MKDSERLLVNESVGGGEEAVRKGGGGGDAETNSAEGGGGREGGGGGGRMAALEVSMSTSSSPVSSSSKRVRSKSIEAEDEGGRGKDEEADDDDEKSVMLSLKTARPRNSVGVVVAGTILGNVLEWYDFSVYSAFAVEIGENFFPDGGTGDENGGGEGGCGGGGAGNSLLATLAVFGAAFVARPIGGILMGHIGDKMGRTLALQLSVILQGCAAVAISVLPSNVCPGSCKYQIGLPASILLIIVRLAQGVSVGGELVGSMIYSAETAPPGQKAMLACVPLSSAFIGTAIGYLVAGILHLAMSATAIRTWGWRLGFALGTPLAVVACFMRRWLHESEDFEREKERSTMEDVQDENKGDAASKKKKKKKKGGSSKAASPLVRTLREQKGAIVIVMFAVCLWAMGNWLAASWVRIFYTELIADPVGASFGAILNFCVILSAGLIFYPVTAIADRLNDGVFRVMIAGCCFVSVLAMPLMVLLQQGRGCYFCVVFAHMWLIFGVAIFGAPMTAWMTHKFPVALRYSALAIAYNLSQMLFGGIAPFLATAMSCNSSYTPLGGLLFVLAAIVSLVAVIVGDKTAWGKRAFVQALEEQKRTGYEEVEGGGGPRRKSSSSLLLESESVSTHVENKV